METRNTLRPSRITPEYYPDLVAASTMPITYGSVCSGIEAASAAWHALGWAPAWFAEIEPFPVAVLAARWPNVPNLGDMTKIADLVRRGLVVAPDVLVGGTPCQAFSVAGARAGLNDERGQLTLRFMELANAIDDVRRSQGKPPCVIVWENVPGVLSDKTNAFGCLLGGLAGEDSELQPPGRKWTNAGCVFGPQRAIAWRILDAQYFGVAQRRRRVFLVASAGKGTDPASILFERDGVRRDSAPSREPRQNVTDTLSSRTSGGGGLGTDFECSGDLQAVDLRNGTLTGDMTHTIQAGCHAPDPGTTPHVLAMSVALRGREGGATAELGGDIAGCLRASTGGGDKPHVLASISVAGGATNCALPHHENTHRRRNGNIDSYHRGCLC